MAEQVAERLHDIEAVMRRLNLGRSKVFELIADGRLRSIKVGRRRLVSESALVQCITNLDQQGPSKDSDPLSEAAPA
jgi:excisionase family DNA binding protein